MTGTPADVIHSTRANIAPLAQRVLGVSVTMMKPFQATPMVPTRPPGSYCLAISIGGRTEASLGLCSGVGFEPSQDSCSGFIEYIEYSSRPRGS